VSTRGPSRNPESPATEGKAASARRRAEKPRSARRAPASAPVHLGTEKGQWPYRRADRSDPAAHWEALSQAYERLTQALLVHPALPPVDELDAFSALAVRSSLSPHEMVALHYATLNQLLACDERYAAESVSASRRALVSVLLRLMGEYRRSSGDAVVKSAGR
jgi:hypothetical protein